MKPRTLYLPLDGSSDFDEISAVETEADGLACNDLSPSQIHVRNVLYPELLAVMDFIFHVDLSTAYVVLRRDFVTSQDPRGCQSSPVGAGFYCMATQMTTGIKLTSAEQIRPRQLTRRPEHTAPKKPQRTATS